MTADLFEDSGELLLARGTDDPIEALRLSQAEKDQLDLVRGEANAARTLAQVGLVLGAAFLLYRSFVHRTTKEDLSPQPESRVLQALALRNARNFIPAWVYMVTPALETAYTIGSVRGGGKMVPDEMVTQFSQRYAVDIANYFNETSAQALTEGFNTYVNRKLARRVAAEKALEGFGLNSRMMRALVGRIARGKVDSPLELDSDASTRDYIEMMLVQRAHDIGDNEGFNVSQHGQQITWLYLQKTGRLSMQALKVWHTARDERVCPSCGPMDKQAVLVSDPFTTDYGKLWVPSMHPSCRCEVRLRTLVREDFVLAKADDRWLEREHPRGEGGRFRAKPAPARPVAERERPVDPFLQRALAEVEIPPVELPPVEEAVELPEAVSLGEAEAPLAPVSLAPVSLAPVSLEPTAVEAPGVSMAQPGVSIARGPAVLAGLSQIDLTTGYENLVRIAGEDLKVKLEDRRLHAAKAPARHDVIHLPDTLWFMDTGGFHYHEEGPHHVDQTDAEFALFRPQDHFVTMDAVTDQAEILYTREINSVTRAIMTSGQNYLKSEGLGDVVLDEGRVQLAVTAEVLGLDDEPELRSYAQAMGVHREEWVTVQYKMDRAYAEGFEGDTFMYEENDYWEVPGRYRIDAEELLPGVGWPIIVMSLEPEVEEEDVPEWRADGDDWQYS